MRLRRLLLIVALSNSWLGHCGGQITPAHAFDQVYDGMQCQPCDDTSFCSGGARLNCPANSTTTFSHENGSPSDIEDCVCLPGLRRDNDTCVLGPAGAFFFQEGLALPCPQHKLTYANGESLESQCLCVPGYFASGDMNGVCEPCAADSYNPLQNQTECLACPARSSHALMASAAVTDCLCDAGSFRQTDAPGECELCAAGHFKNESGPAACLPCGVSSTSSPDRVFCECDAGHTSSPPNSAVSAPVCQACAAHTFKEALGQQACDDCGTHMQSLQGSTLQSQCLCKEGFAFTGLYDTCIACEAGKYKATVSNGLDGSDCLACAADSFSRNASTNASDCSCNAGFSPGIYQEGCNYCDPGYFKAEPGPELCDACAAGTYNPFQNATRCLDCYAGAVALEASVALDDCECLAGSAVNASAFACQTCAPGSFGALQGGTCEACGNGTFSAEAGLTACATCEMHSSSNIVPRVVCECDAGYDTQQACPGNSSCVRCRPCPVDFYKASFGDIGCTACQANSESHSASVPQSSCQCSVGFMQDGASECVACGPGTFSDTLDAVMCATCGDNDFANESASAQCKPCWALSTNTSDNTDCECLPGSTPAGMFACELCAADTYREAPAIVPPTFSDLRGKGIDSALDLWTEAGISKWVVGGTHLSGQGDCTKTCRDKQMTCTNTLNANVFSAMKATEMTLVVEAYAISIGAAYRCLDYVRFTTSNRAPIVFGNDCYAQRDNIQPFTCAGAHDTEARLCPCVAAPAPPPVETCLSCRVNSRSNVGSSLVSQCECVAGFYLLGAASDGVCTPCPIGTYKNATGNEECSPCPSNLTTEFTGGQSVEQCVCAPGLWHTDAGVCEFCPADTYKDDFSREECDDCRDFSSSSNLADDQYDCLCNAGYGEEPSDFAWFDEPALDDVPRECQACHPGTHKYDVSNDGCSVCDVNTFTKFSASFACQTCGIFSSTHGRTGQSLCMCVIGFARRGSDDSECEQCAAGKYKDDFNNITCTDCLLCAVGQEVVHECNHTNQIACAECPEFSTSLGRQRAYRGECACNAGYEYLDGRCQACLPGFFKGHTNNSFACETCAAGQYTAATASTTCTSCSAHCENASAPASIVTSECNASRDVICSPCTVCAPGTYVDPECGVSLGNDREDSVCVLCPPGYYCPGAGVLTLCPGGSQSLAGSNSTGDCGCELGYAEVNGVCEACGFDIYCIGGESFDCPAHSLTRGVRNSVIHACHCFVGFYQVMHESSSDNFSCAVCTPNDFCFNNSVYNCSDERMRSVAGSDEAADCRCVDGFYNNNDHTLCLDCERDHFCVNGSIFACADNQWTQGQIRQDECTCRPGLRKEAGVCMDCGLDSFCVGDDRAQVCRANSSTANTTAAVYHDCLCDEGFADAGGANSACESCAAGDTYKHYIGNNQCANCTRCSGAGGLFTSVWCSVNTDALCDACTSCEDGEEYILRQCADMADAECGVCTECNATHEFQVLPCQADYNRECRAFVVDVATCQVGFYRGNHTAVSDSQCLPCLYNDTRLNGQSLHAATTFGQEYNNAYSCNITCLGNSRLRDATRPFLGCASCEEGNVLLKVFPVEMGSATTCEFTCRPGYERVRMADGTDDCYIPRLRSSAARAFSHNVSVGDFSRTEGVTSLRISHTSHGYFAIVVGRAEPEGCRTGDANRPCCFATQWQVSTLAQMGVLEELDGTCSGLTGLTHSPISATALHVDISDQQMQEVAECTLLPEGETCVLVVSIVDVITWRVVSESFALRTVRSVTVAFAPAQGMLTQMLPLTGFDVQVSLWRMLPAGERIFQMRTAARGSAMSVATRVVGMRMLNADEIALQEVECERVALDRSVVVATDAVTHLLADVVTTTVSYWHAGAAVPLFKAFFTLQQANDVHNVMDVAALRNTSLLVPLCAPNVNVVEQFVGQVWTASGLGEAAVNRMQLQDVSDGPPGSPTRGKLDTLLTCIAESQILGALHLRLRRILAVHLRGTPPPSAVVNVTSMLGGVRDFSFDFRRWCLATPAICHLEYIAVHVSQSNYFVFQSCNATHQAAGMAWLRANYGVVHDAGHVAAVCEQQRAMLPFESQAVLINTMKYTSRQKERWNTYMDSTAPLIRSHVWVDFEASPSEPGITI